jgi:hypothetical protein
MAENKIITQLCIVVHDVKKVNANWAKILGIPEEKIETIFPEGIHHYTHGEATDYKDCQVAKYQLESAVEAVPVKLTPEEIVYLEEPYVPHKIVGHQ